jgi:hypothetical protein
VLLFRLSPELLGLALHLPVGARIVRVGWEVDLGTGPLGEHVLFAVEHADFSPVSDAQEIPEVVPVYQRDAVSGVRLVGWKESQQQSPPADSADGREAEGQNERPPIASAHPSVPPFAAFHPRSHA